MSKNNKLAKRIADTLQPYVDSGELAGAVMLVADKEQVLARVCVGFADIAARKPMRPNSMFWIASQTKPMTAAALMMLVEEGKVALEDPVEKILPEFKDQWVIAEQDAEHQVLKKPIHPVTIRNILTHTSGMPFSTSVEHPRLDTLSLAHAVRSYAATPLQWEPGAKYSYANTGFNTAGRMIEVLSGRPYEDFLAARLFQPLGMKDTTFWPDRKQIARLAKVYTPDAQKTGLAETNISQLTYPLDNRRRFPMPGGGLFSTAGDAAIFCRMMLNGGILEGKRYLAEATVAQMSCKQTPAGVTEPYGLGFGIGEGSYEHGGALASRMTIDTRHERVLVFHVQHAGFLGKGENARAAFQTAALAGVSDVL